MSHHDSIQKHIPMVKSFAPNKMTSNTSIPTDEGSQPQLLIKGQGCVTFIIKPGIKHASITFANTANTERLVFRIYNKSTVPKG